MTNADTAPIAGVSAGIRVVYAHCQAHPAVEGFVARGREKPINVSSGPALAPERFNDACLAMEPNLSLVLATTRCHGVGEAA